MNARMAFPALPAAGVYLCWRGFLTSQITYRPYQINAMNAPNQRCECHWANTPNQRYECAYGIPRMVFAMIPRMAFSGTKEHFSYLKITK